MTTANVSIMPDSNTAANFRAGGSAFAAQLAAMGLVQTADTGQIDWLTVGAPSFSDQLMGYEIWRFNDALQSTVPVYVRIEYRCGNSTTTKWVIWIKVGFGTDGAGNLTGTQVSTTYRLAMGDNATLLGNSSCLFSGANNRIAFALFHGVSVLSVSMFCSIERSKDANGADTGDGVIILAAQGGSGLGGYTRFSQYLPVTGGVPNSESRWPAILSNNASSGFGTTLHMGVPIPLAGSMKNPGLGAMVYTVGDYAIATDITLSIYGANHIYRTLGNNWTYVAGVGSTLANNSGGQDSRIAIRWE